VANNPAGASCLLCGSVDPVDAPVCTCAIYINTSTGKTWYWSENPPWNPGVPEWSVLINA
jgi:hypothetical protein